MAGREEQQRDLLAALEAAKLNSEKAMAARSAADKTKNDTPSWVDLTTAGAHGIGDNYGKILGAAAAGKALSHSPQLTQAAEYVNPSQLGEAKGVTQLSKLKERHALDLADRLKSLGLTGGDTDKYVRLVQKYSHNPDLLQEFTGGGSTIKKIVPSLVGVADRFAPKTVAKARNLVDKVPFLDTAAKRVASTNATDALDSFIKRIAEPGKAPIKLKSIQNALGTLAKPAPAKNISGALFSAAKRPRLGRGSKWALGATALAAALGAANQYSKGTTTTHDGNVRDASSALDTANKSMSTAEDLFKKLQGTPAGGSK